MKKILVINYSQSGQLDEIIDNFLLPFEAALIDRIKIFPKKPYPFPWTSKEFFNTMPESVLEEKNELVPINFQSTDYDLVIVGYQPWYLSPSIPTTSLFHNEKFLLLLKDKPVVTIIGARNMWLNSQERIKEFIHNAGGSLVGNIPLIDKTNNTISAITILDWMLSGKKKRYLKIFPLPGISEKDIKSANVFGEIVFRAFSEKSYIGLQKKILDTGLIRIGTDVLFIELRGKKIFLKFASLIKRKGTTAGKRTFYVKLFKYYLLIAMFFVAPVVLPIYYLFVRPFQIASIKRKKQYFCGVKRKEKQNE
ncbi:MAG: hypothetical protein V1904_05990 [Bacteroidota bacterium]